MPTHYGKMDKDGNGKDKPKPKPKSNSNFGVKPATGKLTKFQEDFMKTHKKSHSKAHNDMMIQLMKKGMCPERAHMETMKKVGK